MKIITLLTITILILELSSCVNSNKSDNEQKAHRNENVDSVQISVGQSSALQGPYGYDTTLKDNYRLELEVNDSVESLFLKGRNISKRIASCSKGLPYKNLGYTVADFGEYFAFAHSFGSGNDNYIELIQKETAKNVLKEGSVLIAANEKNEWLFLCEKDSPTIKDKMLLYDLSKDKREYYNFPKEIFDEQAPLRNIRLDTITAKRLIVLFTIKGKERKVVYFR